MSSQEISLESIYNKINELGLTSSEKEELQTLKSKLQSIKDNLYYSENESYNYLFNTLIKTGSYSVNYGSISLNNNYTVYNNFKSKEDVIKAFTTGFSDLKTLLDSL